MILFTFCLWAESFKTIVKNPPPPAPAKEQPTRSKQPGEVTHDEMEDLSPCMNFLTFSMNMSTIFGMEPAKQASLSSRKHQLLSISLLLFSSYDAMLGREESWGGACIHIPGAMTSFCFWYLSKHLPISARLPVGMGKVNW